MAASELFRTMIAVAGAYLLGAISTAFLISRRPGPDIRAVGDGNMGARNVAPVGVTVTASVLNRNRFSCSTSGDWAGM